MQIKKPKQPILLGQSHKVSRSFTTSKSDNTSAALAESWPESGPDFSSIKIDEEFAQLLKNLKQIQPKEQARQFTALAESLRGDSPNKEWVGLRRAPAGRRIHHSKEGGLVAHINQMTRFALKLYHDTPAPFKNVLNPSDIIIVCFLHDLHKARRCFMENPKASETGMPFDYVPNHESVLPDDIQTLCIVNEAGIVLSEDQVNAIICAEGGYGRYADMDRSKLAVMLGLADDYSASILKK